MRLTRGRPLTLDSRLHVVQYQHMSNQSPLIGSAEVCQRLGIERSTLSRWVKSGRIAPALKMSGLRGGYLFHPDTIAALERSSGAA